MPATRSLVTAVIFVGAGYMMIRHARQMLHEDVGVEAGGGWTAVSEFLVAMIAAAAAFS